MLDFFALILVRRHLQLVAPLAFDQVFRVAALVLDELAARDLERLGRHAIEKVTVVRDQDDSAFVRLQVVLEPVAGFDIQMIGRLVEHHELGRVEQKLGQRDPHSDAAGELRDVAAQVLVGKPKSEQHRLRAALGAVKAVALEVVEHFAEFVQRSIVPGSGMVAGEDRFQFQAPAIQLLHPVERRERFGERAAPAHLGRVLRKIADPAPLRPRDAPRVGRGLLGDHPQQRRFARAVEADQADPRVVGHRPVHAVQNLAGAERLGDVIERKHGQTSNFNSRRNASEVARKRRESVRTSPDDLYAATADAADASSCRRGSSNIHRCQGTLLAARRTFTMPTIREGDRLMVIDRRLFRDDNTRIFVGVVEEFDDGVFRARGFSYHVSPYEVGGMERRGDERVRVISMDAGDIVYLLPREQDITRLQLKRSPKSMSLTDGTFSMDLSDFLLRA